MDQSVNLGTRTRQMVPPARFPDAGSVADAIKRERPADAVDVLLVNPPSPDGGIWIRSQHRAGGSEIKRVSEEEVRAPVWLQSNRPTG